jgi:ATP-dependent Lon protease
LNEEVKRLSKLPSGSHEAAVIRTYLDNCLALPWNQATKDIFNIESAEKILERDHYGLETVKERILELLAVRKLSPDIKGQILCFVGPPGVGKTSITRSIAQALGRKYVRISLGGVRDESDIRGHRKTYVGAMPGRIMEAIKRAGSNNPVLLLDEVDKLGHDYNGDPSSALLKVLDPEQNNTFVDHYIEVPFDLSKVLFITTANDMDNIPRPLLDRMEIIELGSYTREEKFQIAKRYLVPKQRKMHGLNGREIVISDEALYDLIDHYTKEAGVRNLEREIASLCRKTAKKIVSGSKKQMRITPAALEELLGPQKFKEDDLKHDNELGLVNGLAWTSVGGELLQVEAVILEGTGKVELTGSLGDVMKESAHAAISYIRSISSELGIEPDFYKNKDIHLHFPEGAVPKDGPSAGITIFTSLVSAMTKNPVDGLVAMTGEITIRGRVLPIGGLKEKTMAALRASVSTVILPEENRSALAEIDQTVRAALQFVPVRSIDEVLDAALIPAEEKNDAPGLPLAPQRELCAAVRQ